MPDLPVIEPFYVPDVFAHRLHATEEVGSDLFRFVFTVEQTSSIDGSVEHVVCCKLVVPKSFAIANSKAAVEGMGLRGMCMVK